MQEDEGVKGARRVDHDTQATSMPREQPHFYHQTIWEMAWSKRGLIFPLPTKSNYDYIIIDYTWSDEEAAAFIATKKFPQQIHDLSNEDFSPAAILIRCEGMIPDEDDPMQYSMISTDLFDNASIADKHFVLVVEPFAGRQWLANNPFAKSFFVIPSEALELDWTTNANLPTERNRKGDVRDGWGTLAARLNAKYLRLDFGVDSKETTSKLMGFFGMSEEVRFGDAIRDGITVDRGNYLVWMNDVLENSSSKQSTED